MIMKPDYVEKSESFREIHKFNLVPTLRLPFFLIIISAVFVGGFWRESNALYVVAAVLSAALLLSFICALVIKLCCKVSFGFDNRRIQRGSEAHMLLKTRNRSVVPVFCVRVNVFFPTMNDDGEVIGRELTDYWAGITCGALSEEALDISAVFKYAGGYDAEVREISLYDPLGLFRCVNRKVYKIKLAVLPVISPDMLSQRIFVESGEYTNMPPVSDNGEEFFDIRSYIPGDSLNDIHWKLAAKADDLPVIRRSSEACRHYLIVCDCGEYAGGGLAELNACDDVLCYISGVLDCSASERIRLAWCGGSFDAESKADAYKALECAAMAERHDEGAFPIDVSGVGVDCAGMTVVTARISDDIMRFIADFRFKCGDNVPVSVVLCGDYGFELPEKQLSLLNVSLIKRGGEPL